jgi:hypothetical protein
VTNKSLVIKLNHSDSTAYPLEDCDKDRL